MEADDSKVEAGSLTLSSSHSTELRELGQKSSKLISGMTGICIDFDAIG